MNRNEKYASDGSLSQASVLRRLDNLWGRQETHAFPFQLPIGETFLERYEVVDFVGAGTFGVVYRVFDKELEREVALKLPRAEVLVDDGLLERFSNEVLLAAKLEHQGIVKLYEAQLRPPICYFTSAFCAGTDLAKWAKLQDGNCGTWREVVDFVAKVAESVHYAHQQGVYHRDIKPANILLAPKSSQVTTAKRPLACYDPKLADFGLARVVDLTMTQNLSSFIAGTPLYMAPEQFLKKQQAEHLPAADIYSLGVILFELLAGQAPLAGETYAEILDAHRSKKPLKLAHLKKGLPVQLQHICERCLEKDPSARYSTAGELASDLQAVSSGQEIRIRRNGLWAKVKWWAKRPERIRFAGWYVILTALFISFWFLVVVVVAPWVMPLTKESQQLLWLDIAEITCFRVPLYCLLGWYVLKQKRWAIWLAVLTSAARTLGMFLMMGQPLYFNEIYQRGGAMPWVDHLMVLIAAVVQLGMCILAANADIAMHSRASLSKP